MLRYIFVELWTYDPNQTKALELPKEHEMSPRDKYTVFSPHARGYRKGVHKVPKFTRVRSKRLFLRSFLWCCCWGSVGVKELLSYSTRSSSIRDSILSAEYGDLMMITKINAKARRT